MNSLVQFSLRLLRVLLVVCLTAMVILVFGNVVLRYGFNSGIAISEELSRWFFVYLIFLGALLALYENAHLGVDTLLRRLPLAGKKACFFVSQILMLYATWLILRGSWTQMAINFNTAAPASGLSMAWFYGIGVVFGVASIPILLQQIWRVLSGSSNELILVKDSQDL
jgi:TRAP-type transport system small permease protein